MNITAARTWTVLIVGVAGLIARQWTGTGYVYAELEVVRLNGCNSSGRAITALAQHTATVVVVDGCLCTAADAKAGTSVPGSLDSPSIAAGLEMHTRLTKEWEGWNNPNSGRHSTSFESGISVTPFRATSAGWVGPNTAIVFAAIGDYFGFQPDVGRYNIFRDKALIKPFHSDQPANLISVGAVAVYGQGMTVTFKPASSPDLNGEGQKHLPPAPAVGFARVFVGDCGMYAFNHATNRHWHHGLLDHSRDGWSPDRPSRLSLVVWDLAPSTAWDLFAASGAFEATVEVVKRVLL